MGATALRWLKAHAQPASLTMISELTVTAQRCSEAASAGPSRTSAARQLLPEQPFSGAPRAAYRDLVPCEAKPGASEVGSSMYGRSGAQGVDSNRLREKPAHVRATT